MATDRDIQGNVFLDWCPQLLEHIQSCSKRRKNTQKFCNIVCGILFLTEGSGQPQLSRVFQEVPKRRTISNTASHTGLSPSHTEIEARFCLCGMFVLA